MERMIFIETIAVENEVAGNVYQRSELDWLIDNVCTAGSWRRLGGVCERYTRASVDGLRISAAEPTGQQRTVGSALFQFATRSFRMTVCFIKCYRESFGRHVAWRT